jgi:hypothetical protein
VTETFPAAVARYSAEQQALPNTADYAALPKDLMDKGYLDTKADPWGKEYHYAPTGHTAKNYALIGCSFISGKTDNTAAAVSVSTDYGTALGLANTFNETPDSNEVVSVFHL